MARERRFNTPEALRRATNKYFRSIRREVEVTELVPTGELDDYGHPLMKEQKVINEYGNVVKRYAYAVPPQMTALRIAIDVDLTTWRRYANGEIGDNDDQKEDFKLACAEAKAECENWLRHEKLTRKKGLSGIIHELENHYGDAVALDIKERKIKLEEKHAEDEW